METATRKRRREYPDEGPPRACTTSAKMRVVERWIAHLLESWRLCCTDGAEEEVEKATLFAPESEQEQEQQIISRDETGQLELSPRLNHPKQASKSQIRCSRATDLSDTCAGKVTRNRQAQPSQSFPNFDPAILAVSTCSEYCKPFRDRANTYTQYECFPFRRTSCQKRRSACYPSNCSHCGRLFFSHERQMPFDTYDEQHGIYRQRIKFCGKNCRITAAMDTYCDVDNIFSITTSSIDGTFE